MNSKKRLFIPSILALMLSFPLFMGTTNAQEAPICESVVRDSTTLTVTYSKTEVTCAHLINASSQLTHVVNFFCAVGAFVATTEPLTSFGTNAGALGDLIEPLILCNGNAKSFCTACGPIVGPAVAQTWTQLGPTGGPPIPRTQHSAVHNPTTNRMIMFGGQDNGIIKQNDVWVLENADGLGGDAQLDRAHPDRRATPSEGRTQRRL